MESIRTGQHFVPQMLLKGFCEANSKRIWVLEKETSRSYATNIRNVACQKGFYDFSVGSKTVSFDSSLSKLESHSAPIFDRLRSGSGLRSLSRQDRIVISAFVAAQYLRTDAQRKRYRRLTEDIYEAMKGRGSTDQLLNSLAPIDAEQAKRETILMLPRFTVEVAPLVLNKKWILYRADGRCEFLLSDSPVVMCNNFANGAMLQGDIGFAVKGVEIFLPISRKLCVCFFCPSIVDLFSNSKSKTARGGQESISRMLKAFEAEELGVGPEHVLHANGLQLANAERLLFGSLKELENAKCQLESNSKAR